MSGDEALAYMIKQNLTQAQYQEQRNEGLKRGANFLPPYSKISEAMKQSLPNNINYESDCVWVSMQEVLNHRLSRLLDSEMIERLQILQDLYPDMKVLLYYKVCFTCKI